MVPISGIRSSAITDRHRCAAFVALLDGRVLVTLSDLIFTIVAILFFQGRAT